MCQKKPRLSGSVALFSTDPLFLANLAALIRTKTLVVRTVPTQAWVSFVLSRLHLI